MATSDDDLRQAVIDGLIQGLMGQGLTREEAMGRLGLAPSGGYPEIPEELRNIIPKAPTPPNTGDPQRPSMVGGAPTGTPLAPSQVPATATQGLVEQSPGVTGGILNPSQIAAMQAPKSAATSLLSQWLVPAIGAASGLGGALIQRSAVNKATDAQTEASDEALKLKKEMYEQDRADYAPYRNLGAFSLGQLGHLTGMPSNFGTQAVDAATAPRTAIHRDGGTNIAQQGLTPWPANQPTRDPMFRTPGYGPEFQSLRDLGARQQSASSFVRMRAPSGEEEDVHPSEVPLFEAHGATRI